MGADHKPDGMFSAHGDFPWGGSTSHLRFSRGKTWVYPDWASTLASVDPWRDGDVVISNTTEFRYFSGIDIRNHRGLIHRYPLNNALEIKSLADATRAIVPGPTVGGPPDLGSWIDNSTDPQYLTQSNNRARLRKSSSGDNIVLDSGPVAGNLTYLVMRDVDTFYGQSLWQRYAFHVRTGAKGGGIFNNPSQESLQWSYGSGGTPFVDSGLNISAEVSAFWLYADHANNQIAIWKDGEATPRVADLPHTFVSGVNVATIYVGHAGQGGFVDLDLSAAAAGGANLS